jgi:hypothetical protein
MQALAPFGYSFYLYAPKADAYLRRRWRDPHPREDMAALIAFGAACRAAGVKFGVGLTPFELHFTLDAAGRSALKRKLDHLSGAGCDWIAILFDDMRGDIPELAQRQAEIVHLAAERISNVRMSVCPSYYTDDLVLDRVFGRRPERYLEDLADALPMSIDILWTGEEVCSREYSTSALDAVAAAIGRKPFLWDNYPVNDGPRMSNHLHLRAFTGRSARIRAHIAGHAVNPASQATLTRIPMLTMAAAYGAGDDYAYGAAFSDAARMICGDALAAMLQDDLLTLADEGLDRLSPRRKARLRSRYAELTHPAAQEVVAWIDGLYAVTGEALQTQ